MSIVSCERVQTSRLLCERLQVEHEAEMSILLRDPRVAKTLAPRGLPPSEREVLDGLRAKISHWERYGFGLWMVRDRTSGEMVGRGGLQHTVVGGSSEIEVGWAIVPERWGQGFATELALVSVDVATEPLHLPEIVAFTLPDNIASRRVMEKAGFGYERDLVHVGLPHVLYRRALRDGTYGRSASTTQMGTNGKSRSVSRPAASGAAGSSARLIRSAPLTRSREARKEHVASHDGRPRPR